MRRVYGAIPTVWNQITFRSRLEAKWAVLMTLWNWRFEYEPVDLAAFKIPDFVVYFETFPIIIECKPAVTVREVEAYRKTLHRAAAPWILQDIAARREKLEEDCAEDGGMWSRMVLQDIDYLIEDAETVEAGDHPYWGRRALVVGSQLFIDDKRNACSLDGRHYLTDCRADDHVGLTDIEHGGDFYQCLFCSEIAPRFLKSSDALRMWRDAGDKARWVPSR